MNPARFDSLSKSLSTIGTRRGLVRFLLGVPLAGSLAGLLDPMATDAKRPVDRVRDRAARKQQKRHNPGQHKDNPTHKRRGNGGKGGKGGKKGNGGNSPLPFGADCTSSAACDSGICACRAHGCSTGGFCADAVTASCPNTDVFTPEGTATVCANDAPGSCDSGPCANPNDVCAVAEFCVFLTPA
jgi:hypothetical protein